MIEIFYFDKNKAIYIYIYIYMGARMCACFSE